MALPRHIWLTPESLGESPIYPLQGDAARLYAAGMGRNFASATELVRQMIGELEHVGEVLPLTERHILKQFCDFALNNRAAIANAASLTPLEVMLLVVLVDERKRSERIEYELRRDIERLKADLM